MKLYNLVPACLSVFFLLTACKKNDDPVGESVGKLLTTPAIINGIFKVDSVLTADNYVDVQIEVSVGGSFNIKSDSINGYSVCRI